MLWPFKTPSSDTSQGLIFCINSGRSGSGYLGNLLATAEKVAAFHEPEPTMSGKYLDMVMRAPLADSASQRMCKVRAIRSQLAKLPQDWTYVETNHMFIKTFFDVVMAAFSPDRLSIVILRRDLAKILYSFIRLGYFSDMNPVWSDWMHRVPSANSPFTPFMPYESMDSYDRAISYLIDIEARAVRFKENYPLVRIVETDLEDLQNREGVTALFSALGLSPTAKTWENNTEVVNDRSERKQGLNIPCTEDYCRERIEKYLENCRKSGISLPRIAGFY